MLGVTMKQSRNHSILAETFSTILTSKFTQLLEDMHRVYKKVFLLLYTAVEVSWFLLPCFKYNNGCSALAASVRDLVELRWEEMAYVP